MKAIHRPCSVILPAALVLALAVPAFAGEAWVADPWAVVTATATTPADAPKIMQLTAARGGIANGMVVVADTVPLRSLPVRISEFSGPQPLPATAVRVRFPTRETDLGPGNEHPEPLRWFDAISPQLVPGEKLQPVLVTVDVPPNAAPGKYSASLMLAGKTFPIQLNVGAFVVPSLSERLLNVELIQSPESLAKRYGVPMWSEAHFALIEQSLAMIGRLGGNIMQVPVIGRTRLGYETGLISFTKRGQELVPDFTAFDRYLALWLKHCGKPRFIVLNVWEIYMRPAKDKPSPDSETVDLTINDGANWTTVQVPNPELGKGDQPWRALVLGTQERALKAGLAKYQVVIGQMADTKAGKVTVDMYKAIDPALRWSVWTHGYGYASNKEGMTSETGANIGLSRGPDIDPHVYMKGLGRSFVQEPKGLVRLKSIRCFINHGEPVSILWRMSPDLSFCDGHGSSSGYGPIGVDFLPLVKSGEKKNRWYTQWGGPYPGLKYCRLDRGQPGAVAIAGPKGVLPTLRGEALAEGALEAEARLILEVRDRKNPVAIELAKSRYLDLPAIATNNGLKDKFAPYKDPNWHASLLALYNHAGALQQNRHATP